MMIAACGQSAIPLDAAELDMMEECSISRVRGRPLIARKSLRIANATSHPVVSRDAFGLPARTNLFLNGVNQAAAAFWNGSGEFWATTDPARALWFALSHPNSPPAALFAFDLPEQVLLALLAMAPPVVAQHGATDYEFLPPSFAQLNAAMLNRQVIPVP